MNYRRNVLLAGVASLALVVGAGFAQAEEKEKAPEAKPPQAAQPMKKAPMAAEQPKEGVQPAQKAEENERMKQTPQRAEENGRTKQTPQRAEENERTNKAGQAATQPNRSGPSAAANVKLSADQRTRIKTIVLAGNGGPRVTNVNFDVRVGVVVPRGGVEYVPVPEALVAIEPAWAGFLYFIYGEEVVIIDPDTLAIVAVVPV
jgi:hypothetical protein